MESTLRQTTMVSNWFEECMGGRRRTDASDVDVHRATAAPVMDRTAKAKENFIV
jgi:hypothetical protein